jgi:hypothetical protein
MKFYSKEEKEFLKLKYGPNISFGTSKHDNNTLMKIIQSKINPYFIYEKSPFAFIFPSICLGFFLSLILFTDYKSQTHIILCLTIYGGIIAISIITLIHIVSDYVKQTKDRNKTLASYLKNVAHDFPPLYDKYFKSAAENSIFFDENGNLQKTDHKSTPPKE